MSIDKKDCVETPETEKIKEQIEELEKKKNIQKNIKNEPCYFTTNKGQKQIVKNIKVKSKDASKVDSVIITDKTKTNRVQRLTKDIYDDLKSNQTPFVAKLNDTTLNVDLYNTSKGQVIGLNYFSSIKNNISSKINESKIELIKDSKDKITIQKGDLLEIENLKDNSKKYFVFNGGGEVAGGNNKIKTKPINTKSTVEIKFTLNEKTIVKKVNIDFYGNITYEEFKK